MTLQRITSSILFASVALLASACDLGEKPIGNDTAQGESESESDGGDNGDGDGDGDGPDDPSGDGDGDGEVPGGNPDPAIVDACTATCELYESCDMAAPDCLDSCINAHLAYGDDVECVSVELNLTECLAGLDCEQLTQFSNEDPMPFPCQTESEALCEPPLGECELGGETGLNPGECSVDFSCDGEPVRSVACDGEVCTCFVDKVEVGGCADAQGVCGALDEAAIDACCG